MELVKAPTEAELNSVLSELSADSELIHSSNCGQCAICKFSEAMSDNSLFHQLIKRSVLATPELMMLDLFSPIENCAIKTVAKQYVVGILLGIKLGRRQMLEELQHQVK